MSTPNKTKEQHETEFGELLLSSTFLFCFGLLGAEDFPLMAGMLLLALTGAIIAFAEDKKYKTRCATVAQVT